MPDKERDPLEGMSDADSMVFIAFFIMLATIILAYSLLSG